MILNLISGPRNVSTALMYSFAQRTDTFVLDEPFYAVYLSRSKAAHPGTETVLLALPQAEEEVIKKIFLSQKKPVLFLKNMAHHMEVLDHPFVHGAVNIFLIRDPKEIIASYSKVIQKPVMRDIGIKFQYTLFSQLQEKGQEPIVIDSGFLLKDPSSVLQKLCLRCGLEFDQRMVHWPKGPKPYDGVWAKFWYANVHLSSGFDRQPTSSQPLPAGLQGLYTEAASFYEKLVPFSIKA
ncbi:MAG: sulfotransferase family protein [Cyclobacteriaceae bacterium]